MTTFSAANQASAPAGQARGVAGWLALAAAPSFAVMAAIGGGGAHAAGLCSTGSPLLPIDGMTAMYGLMSLFHLSPWLALASGRPWARN